MLKHGRRDASKAVFLITDGYSNGGNPIPVAKQITDSGVQMFTFGIRNGNCVELYDMASEPKREHLYILDSFEEFEALARRALHGGRCDSIHVYKSPMELIQYYALVKEIYTFSVLINQQDVYK